jgi:1-phosphofructokinase family hexose kinase
MIVTLTPNPALDRTLTVPEIVFNMMVRATDTRLDLDGKGVNVSKALQALGTTTRLMGYIGGATGEMLERGLKAMGLETDFTIVSGETRTNTIVIDATSNQYVKANEPGPTIGAGDVAAICAQLQSRVRPGDTWIFSGSLPPGAPADFYAQLIGLAQAGGARALLDASGEPLRLGCAAGPYLVKPNADEAQEITGYQIATDDDARAAAHAFLDRGCQLVALSLGADGLLLASRTAAVRARPPVLQARNPVGAGDALLAGIAWAMERGLPLEEQARWGVASGTAAAIRDGTGSASRQEIEAIYAQVQIGR